jgi:hypothetical protein
MFFMIKGKKRRGIHSAKVELVRLIYPKESLFVKC